MNQADKRLKRASLIFHIKIKSTRCVLKIFCFAAELLGSTPKQKINDLIEFFFSDDRGSHRYWVREEYREEGKREIKTRR